jgi:hypothetical protein
MATAITDNLQFLDTERRPRLDLIRVPQRQRALSRPLARVLSFPLEAMEVTGKSKTGEAGRKVAIARADARASELAPIVADIRRGGVTSWYGIAMELNIRRVPTATGKGIWEPGQVRRLMERTK